MKEYLVYLTDEDIENLCELLHEHTGYHPEFWNDEQKDLMRIANKLYEAIGSPTFGGEYLYRSIQGVYNESLGEKKERTSRKSRISGRILRAKKGDRNHDRF